MEVTERLLVDVFHAGAWLGQVRGTGVEEARLYFASEKYETEKTRLNDSS
jgi:hypothetical protein